MASETRRDVDRTNIYDWDNSGRDLSQYRLFNPLAWLLIAVEFLSALRWYVWHKRQSWKAKRLSVHTDVVFGLQSCDFVLNDEDVPEGAKDDVQKVRDHLESIADELNLESDQLDRYVETGGEVDDGN